jgi:hypothetical protein
MRTLLFREFSLARDFRSIRWGATLAYNLERAAGAGLVWGALMYAIPQSAGDQRTALLLPVVLPLAYLLVIIPVSLILSVLSQAIAPVGLASLLLAVVTVTAGDPLVCLLKAIAPRAVPVAAPSLFSASLVIFVIDADEIVIGR